MRGRQGRRSSHTLIIANINPITAKKAAVGVVQAIQFICSLLYPAQGEALGDVIADEPDHQHAGQNRQHTGGG